MKYRGIFEYEYPTEHKPPVSIDVHLHGDCVKGEIIEWEYRPLEQEPKIGHWIIIDDCELFMAKCSECGQIVDSRIMRKFPYCHCGAKMEEGEQK